jgi:hypothetical protein
MVMETFSGWIRLAHHDRKEAAIFKLKTLPRDESTAGGGVTHVVVALVRNVSLSAMYYFALDSSARIG